MDVTRDELIVAFESQKKKFKDFLVNGTLSRSQSTGGYLKVNFENATSVEGYQVHVGDPWNTCYRLVGFTKLYTKMDKIIMSDSAAYFSVNHLLQDNGYGWKIHRC